MMFHETGKVTARLRPVFSYPTLKLWTQTGTLAMVHKMNEADIYAMFERVGVDPAQRDREELHELMKQQQDRTEDRKVTYRTVLTNGTGKSMRGGMDAELESNTR